MDSMLDRYRQTLWELDQQKKKDEEDSLEKELDTPVVEEPQTGGATVASKAMPEMDEDQKILENDPMWLNREPASTNLEETRKETSGIPKGPEGGFRATDWTPPSIKDVQQMAKSRSNIDVNAGIPKPNQADLDKVRSLILNSGQSSDQVKQILDEYKRLTGADEDNGLNYLIAGGKIGQGTARLFNAQIDSALPEIKQIQSAQSNKLKNLQALLKSSSMFGMTPFQQASNLLRINDIGNKQTRTAMAQKVNQLRENDRMNKLAIGLDKSIDPNVLSRNSSAGNAMKSFDAANQVLLIASKIDDPNATIGDIEMKELAANVANMFKVGGQVTQGEIKNLSKSTLWTDLSSIYQWLTGNYQNNREQFYDFVKRFQALANREKQFQMSNILNHISSRMLPYMELAEKQPELFHSIVRSKFGEISEKEHIPSTSTEEISAKNRQIIDKNLEKNLPKDNTKYITIQNIDDPSQVYNIKPEAADKYLKNGWEQIEDNNEEE